MGAEEPIQTVEKVPRGGWWAPVLLVALAPTAMLYTLWLNPVSAGEDDVIYYYPLRKLVGQQLRHGQYPEMNRFEATGMPLMADPQSAVMHPLTWLFAVMEAKPAYSISLMVGFAAAGLGMLLYLRRLGLIRPAAVFGAVAFMFCGFLVGHRVHLSVLHAAACLPWGLWLIERLRDRPLSALAGLVPVGYLALTAGHWPTFIHMTILWGAYLLLRGRPLLRSLAVAGVAGLLVIMLAAPQIEATVALMNAVTRSRIGYAMAGENSYHPASAALMVFPMLYGARTENFLAGQWWGPWHLCETLGYVGLATLVLALAGVWRLYRKNRDANSFLEDISSIDKDSYASKNSLRPCFSLVRVWTWIAIGALVWMLGYYLPTYRLIHMLPVLGVMRCPARMLLGLDMALATIAAISLHVIATGSGPRADRLTKSVRRGATFTLPIAMAVVLAGLAAVAGLAMLILGGYLHGFSGSASTALARVLPTNPSVWVQVVLLVATILVVRWWLKAPRRRAAALTVLLLVDLFFVTRFVDVPPPGAVGPDPDDSPAARWLATHDMGRDYLVWGIGETYYDRAAELLRPKTAHALGVATINSYGPFQSAAHAELLEFRIFGTNRNWAWLIRDNYLLSRYGVRYVITARRDVRDVLESVGVGDANARPDGPSLLGEQWRLHNASDEWHLTLQKPLLGFWSTAEQNVRVKANTVYRISLEALAPEGADNYLRAEVQKPGLDMDWSRREPMGLMAYPEQIGDDWRRFEWTFRTPEDFDGNMVFRIYTESERPIWVGKVKFRESDWDRPRQVVEFAAMKGTRLYRLRAELLPRRPGDEPVAIYENMAERPWSRLGYDGQVRSGGYGYAAPLEKEKWRRNLALANVTSTTLRGRDGERLTPMPLHDLGIRLKLHADEMLYATAAGLVAWLLLVAVANFAAEDRRLTGRADG